MPVVACSSSHRKLTGLDAGVPYLVVESTPFNVPAANRYVHVGVRVISRGGCEPL